MVKILSEDAQTRLKSLNANFRKWLPKSTKRQGEMARILVEVFNAVLSTAVTAEGPKQDLFRVMADSREGRKLFGLDKTEELSDRYECMRAVAQAFKVGEYPLATCTSKCSCIFPCVHSLFTFPHPLYTYKTECIFGLTNINAGSPRQCASIRRLSAYAAVPVRPGLPS
jgi:hypothetical protein